MFAAMNHPVETKQMFFLKIHLSYSTTSFLFHLLLSLFGSRWWYLGFVYIPNVICFLSVVHLFDRMMEKDENEMVTATATEKSEAVDTFSCCIL